MFTSNPSMTQIFTSSKIPTPLSSLPSFDSMSQSATVSLQIDDCLNRDLYSHERNEMESILFNFAQQMLYDQHIQILNITIDSQSRVRLLPEVHHMDGEHNRRKLQLVSRRLDVRCYARCTESIDFQSSFEGLFKNADRNIELIHTLKSSNDLNLYFEYASLIELKKIDYLENPSSSFPSMDQRSATPVNDGTNVGTVGAATLAGLGAAAVGIVILNL